MKIEPLENRAGFRVLAPAKVNLFFEILGKRPDGYREIETVVAPISLFDELEFERTETPGIAIESLDEIAGDDSDVPTDQTNLVAKAFRAFWEEKGTDPDFPPFGVKCRLTKRIPTRAGLGGGSSDAAACLLALDRLAPERTPKATLQKIAGRVGSDVALFLEPSASRGRGRGEIVEPRGSLFAQLDGAIAALDRFNRKFVKTLDGREISAREYREFPAEALNEAIVNAIVCRDYSKPISTLIRLYADRVEILSYGALVDGIDAKDLPLGVSASRNPKLAGVFRRLRYIDSLGQGLAGIRKIYQGSGVEPKFEISDNFFRVTLFNAFERRLERVVVSEEAKPRFVPVVDAPATVASQTFVPELTERTNVVAIGTDKALTVIADNPTSGAVKFRRERRYRD